MRQPVELHRLPVGGRAHQRRGEQLEQRQIHIGVVRADEHVQRGLVGGGHQFLDERHALFLSGQHFRRHAVGLQNGLDQRLDIEELLRL